MVLQTITALRGVMAAVNPSVPSYTISILCGVNCDNFVFQIRCFDKRVYFRYFYFVLICNDITYVELYKVLTRLTYVRILLRPASHCVDGESVVAVFVVATFVIWNIISVASVLLVGGFTFLPLLVFGPYWLSVKVLCRNTWCHILDSDTI